MNSSNLTKNKIKEYLKKGKRFDNRKPLDYRDLEVETGISKNAEGSARIKLGKTEVVVGVKLDAGEPYPDSQDEGVMITTAELTPLSSDRFEYGPPRIEAIELARLVDRGIRESGFIDWKKLCIKKGEKVWIIFLDIYTVNDAGNLLDAACLGALAALLTAKMPKYDEKLERVKYGEFTSKGLPLTNIVPLTFTFHKLGENLLLDPIREEEDSSESRITIALSKDKDIRINALQKGNEKALSKKEVFKIIEEAFKKFKESEKVIGKLKK